MQKMGWFGAVRGHSESAAMSPFESAYDFLFDLYRFRDIAGYLWKVADFNPPNLHLVPP